MADPFSQDFWAEHNDLDRAPICAACGVTMLPVDDFGSGFSCQNGRLRVRRLNRLGSGQPQPG